MDRKVYINILENVMLSYAKHFHGHSFIYQQDNHPKLCAAKVRDWFRRRRVTLMEWPSQSWSILSPDLNIIEPLWKELDRRLASKRATNMAKKFAQLEEEWQKILQSILLFPCPGAARQSMPKLLLYLYIIFITRYMIIYVK